MKKIIILLLQSIFCFSQNIDKDCESARVKYLEQNPDVARAGMNAWSHYLSYGKNEGRKWPLCISEEENQTIKLDLTTWKHSNGKFVQTEKLANNRKIWIEDDNRFFYEEISIEGQIVILKDTNRNGVYLKLTPDVCYYKDNNNPSWLYIYSGSWSVPLKVIKSNNNVVSQTKNNSQTKTVIQSTKKEKQSKYKTPPLHLSTRELRAWYDSDDGQKYLNDSGLLDDFVDRLYSSASRKSNNNSNSNSSQKKVFICSDSDGCCKSVITSNSKPADGICNNRKTLKAGQIGHRWNEVGQQGNKQFKCNKCSIVVNTQDSPKGGGCCSVGGCSGGHSWSEVK